MSLQSRWLILLAIVMLLFSGCRKAEVPPPQDEKSSGSDESTGNATTWTHEYTTICPGIVLIHRESDHSSCFFIERDGNTRLLIPEPDYASLRSVSADTVEFIGCGHADNGLVSFPYLLVYDVEHDRLERSELFLRCDEPSHFGYFRDLGGSKPTPIRGQIISDLRSDDCSIVVTFAIGDEHSVLETPETIVSFDEQSHVMHILLLGTRLMPGLSREIASFDLTVPHVRAVHLVDTGEGIDLKVVLEREVFYSVKEERTESKNLDVVVSIRSMP